MSSFLRILKYVSRYWRHGLLNLLFNLLSIAFSAVSLTMIIPFLRLLFGKTPSLEPPLPFEWSAASAADHFNYMMGGLIAEEGREHALAFICFLMVAIFFLKNLFRYLAVYVLAVVRNAVVRDIRSDLYRKVLALPIGFFSGERKGDIMARATSDVQEIEWSV